MRTLPLQFAVLILFGAPAALASSSAVTAQAFIEQRTNAQLPTGLNFRDEQGNAIRLEDFLGARPAILVLVYYSCPNLCPTTLRHLTQGLNGTSLRAGHDFDVIVASFDPRDTPADAARQKAACVAAYNHHDSAGWHFLTGTKPAIEQLTEAVGFHCTFDPDRGQFTHAAAIIVVSPAGRISHYFFGIDVSPADLESALRDAQARRSTAVDQPDQQYCVAYDPRDSATGRRVTRALQGLGVVWAFAIGGYIALKLTQEFRAREAGR
jgi:protein SCO1